MSAKFPAESFLSCDWGTTAFRLHLVDARSGRSLATVNASDGVNAVHLAWRTAGSGEIRENFFLNLVRLKLAKLAATSGRLLQGLPLVMSGMVTSSIGWREIPHKPMPFALDGSDLQTERVDFSGEQFGPVLFVSGARTNQDMMRGEEIQVVGACAGRERSDGLFVLPGTHSKHVTVECRQAIALSTFMTGEFFDLLARRSILANSIEEGLTADETGTEATFVEGVKAGATQNLLHASFGIRVEELSQRRSRSAGYHYLSGLVIGTELGELSSSRFNRVVLVGTAALTARYDLALRSLGFAGTIEQVDAGLAVIAGHQRMARHAGMIA